MDSFLTFLVLLAVLFFLSRSVSQSLGMLIYSLFKFKKVTILLEALIFFPGTVIHELAHLIAAKLLRLETGRISLWPKIEGKSIKLGSVEVEKVDIIRNFLVGVAPIVVGLGLIFTVIKIFEKLQLFGFWFEAGLFYILFEVGNTMFSSRRDMEGALELAIGLSVVFGLLYLAGFQQIFELFGLFTNNSKSFFNIASGVILKIVILDLAVITVSKLLSVNISLRQ